MENQSKSLTKTQANTAHAAARLLTQYFGQKKAASFILELDEDYQLLFDVDFSERSLIIHAESLRSDRNLRVIHEEANSRGAKACRKLLEGDA